MGMKYHASSDFTVHPNGSRCFRTPGPFQSVAKVENCPCEDGVRRNAFTTAEPDTFFSIPACVYVGSKTVGGFLTVEEETVTGEHAGWKFVAYSYGKNAGLIKPASASS